MILPPWTCFSAEVRQKRRKKLTTKDTLASTKETESGETSIICMQQLRGWYQYANTDSIFTQHLLLPVSTVRFSVVLGSRHMALAHHTS